jgi:hypothetical protein
LWIKLRYCIRLEAVMPIVRNYDVLQHTEKGQRTETDKREKRGGGDLFQVNILPVV